MMKDTWKKVAVVIIGIILNVFGRYLSQTLNLPVWLDMIGTCISVYYVGLWGGIITGVSNNLLSAFFDITSLIYSLTSITAAVMMHIFTKKGYMNHALRAAVSSFWLGLLCMVVSTPLNLIFYDGYSGNIWGDALVDMLRWYDVSKVWAALAGEVIVEIVDKQVCVMTAFLIIYFCNKCRKKKVQSATNISGFLAAIMVVSIVLQPINVLAAEDSLFTNNFVEEIYNNTNGMVSSDANDICETDDGYIWIGSYAGLTRYDGMEFEFIREGGLVNVIEMMTDSRGRLWIATNDAGIARYEKGEYTYFTAKDGLPSNSVRCFAEDKQGNVYVGTSDKICRFNTEDKIEIMDYDITFAKAMVIYEKKLIVMDNIGDLYAIDEEKVYTIQDADAKELFYYCIAVTSSGLMAGTDSGELFVMEVTDRGLSIKEEISLSASTVSAVFEDSKERIWIATDSGFGYIDKHGIFREMKYGGFDASIVCFHEDYQGNIWIASTHYGVMKLSESRFINVFEKGEIDKQVVNAVIFYDGDYYCGTDNGLILLDNVRFGKKTNTLTKTIDGSRVRALFKDSENRLWICTYDGLIRYDENHEIYCYNVEKDSATSDRFRCITELKDGTIVAGTADGINFIENEKITKTLTADDGMINTQILTVVEGEDGTVWAGSDGSGIYVISNGELIENYTVEDGLSSNVILRIVPCGTGYLIVTSNALCHSDSDGNIRRLTNFPYFNNYDIITDGETAYVTCSAGLYKVKLSELCEDNGKQIKLYNANEGLLSGLTANSWNYLSEEGRLYLCSNNGVIAFDETERSENSNLKYGVVSIECDGMDFNMSEGEHCIIPANAKNVTLYASVRNYAFADVKVKFYVKELEENPKTYSWNNIEPIQIVKPNTSDYHVCMQILDSSDGTVLQETVYTVARESQMWEKPWYLTYLTIVCLEIILFTLMNVVSMVHFAIRKNQLEKLQIELEQKVSEQTEELRLQQKRTEELYVQTVTALSEAVDAKDRYTSGHSKRVAEYARMLAARMGKSKEEQEEIYRAGLLHDVGKIRIPEEIINKPGKLTDEEFNVIKIHPVTGYHILSGISGSDMIAIGAKYHHERYDGKGYPNGLAGETIPEVARILGVADSYDAMTSNRSYRKGLPQDVVRGEIEKCKGSQFDPEIADIMLQMMDEDKNYTLRQEDLSHKAILVVDDEAMNSKLIKNIMKEEPVYEIVSAYSGAEALEIMEQKYFDLILLDVKMPGMDGLETLQRIREKYSTPVVLITGDKTLDTSKEFAEYGCNDYITKPFQPLLIKEVIHNMAEKTVVGNQSK